MWNIRSMCWLVVAAVAGIGGSLAGAEPTQRRDTIQMDVETVDCSGLESYSPPVYYKKGDEVKSEESGYGDLGRYRCKDYNVCHDHEPKLYSDRWELRGHCKRK